jgi:hypothetical protein
MEKESPGPQKRRTFSSVQIPASKEYPPLKTIHRTSKGRIFEISGEKPLSESEFKEAMANEPPMDQTESE